MKWFPMGRGEVWPAKMNGAGWGHGWWWYGHLGGQQSELGWWELGFSAGGAGLGVLER